MLLSCFCFSIFFVITCKGSALRKFNDLFLIFLLYLLCLTDDTCRLKVEEDRSKPSSSTGGEGEARDSDRHDDRYIVLSLYGSVPLLQVHFSNNDFLGVRVRVIMH